MADPLIVDKKRFYIFKNDNDNRNLGIDLGLTEDCNFACKYCIERGYFTPNSMKEDIYTEVVNKINYMINNTNYTKTVKIGLWGGEPTLNKPAIEYITDSFLGNKNISYGLFTNGKILDQYYDLIHRVVESGNYFQTQISYDGLPIHNSNRIDRNGCITGEIVRARIIEAFKENIAMHLKSTISYKDFDKIYDSYMDICDLADELRELNNNKSSRIEYSPTIDYSLASYNKLNDDNMKEYLEIFEDQMIKICKNEYQRIKNNKKSIFSWFQRVSNKKINDKVKCSAGNRYKVINYNGDVLACHGCVFLTSMNDHYICNINDKNEDFVDRWYDSDKRYNIHNDQISRLAEKCDKCDACMCLACNCVKYEYSKKQNYIDRWWDYGNQPYLCDFYKLASNIIRALLIKCNLNRISSNDGIDVEVRHC